MREFLLIPQLEAGGKPWWHIRGSHRGNFQFACSISCKVQYVRMFHRELPIIYPEHAQGPLGAVDKVFELTIHPPEPDRQVRVRVAKNWVYKCHVRKQNRKSEAQGLDTRLTSGWLVTHRCMFTSFELISSFRNIRTFLWEKTAQMCLDIHPRHP